MKGMLVIEDNKAIAKVIEHIGRSLGFEVTVAHSFSEVKNILVHHQEFFVATVDYSLPYAYEGQVIPYILKYDIPSIVMTGRVNDKIHQQLLNLPIIDYITKESAQAYHYLQRVLKGQLTNHEVGVLVVDDSLSVRSYVCSLLSRRNFTVYNEPDGTKGLETLRQHEDIKLVITDYEMPGMSGIELILNIRKQYSARDLIIIGYSGLNKSYQSARFIKCGADDYLKKPFCPEEFYCRIFKNIEQLQVIEEVKMSTQIDYLTSLSNRQSFIEEQCGDLDELKASESVYCLAIIHIDKFNSINELYGCQAADQVLIKAANLLTGAFSGSKVARLYGAEFGLLLALDSLKQGKLKLSEFLTENKLNTIAYGDESIEFTLSIGAVKLEAQASIHECIEQAEEALFACKNAEEGALTFFEDKPKLTKVG